MFGYQLLPFEAFWAYIIIFAISTLLTVVLGYLLANRAPNPVKKSTFECGQKEDVHPREIFIRGADRYFAYAVAFFILDAFTWIIIAGVQALNIYLVSGLFMATYLLAIIIVLTYYVLKVRERL